MKTFIQLLVLTVIVSSMTRADLRVSAVKGEIYVRHNVQEQWVRVAVGDLLKPDDSIMSGGKSSATINIDNVKKVVVPELAIIDCADLRVLSTGDLLLKLAMEQVRSLPNGAKGKELQIPRTTIVHGESKGVRSQPVSTPNPVAGSLQLNGTRVLFDQGYYATCILKTKHVLRLHPDVEKKTEARLLVASALENLRLEEEALNEYNTLKSERLSPRERVLVEKKVATLAKKRKE